MKVCSECGLSGDRLYVDGSTTVAACPRHPKAKLYRLVQGRVNYGQGVAEPKTAPDVRPHSRACGFAKHDHGPACHVNCPTCKGGRP